MADSRMNLEVSDRLPSGKVSSEISSLYVLKAICAFFVVACHAPNAGMPVFFRYLGVPCFFMITGYFYLYSPDLSKVISRSSKATRKSLLLLGLLTPIYSRPSRPLSNDSSSSSAMAICGNPQ